MQISVVWKCARAVVVRIEDGSRFSTTNPWTLTLNEQLYGISDRVITYIDGLTPQTTYRIQAQRTTEDDKTESVETVVVTDQESVTLDIRDFGAVGNGQRDDTISIQAAISSCPAHGRVVIPKGVYRIKNLFLHSNISIELEEGAKLLARHDREQLAYLPPAQHTTQGVGYASSDIVPMGRWEGESFPMFCASLTGIRVHNVRIYGKGTLDGGASADSDNWWFEPKNIRIATRPRMIFLSECSNIDVAGITVCNSPAWNIHPVLCHDINFYGLHIDGPKDSPNTDGLNPESCANVTILGCHFSVGDDCIAIKSGKQQIEPALRPACSNIVIEHCYMHDGHGSVVLGSEAAGGVRAVHVRHCVFERTDRGLRIKTRRGRGKESVYDAIEFEDIVMDGVKVPFVVNSFYFCDPDGKSDYVQNRIPLPVDDGTPTVASLIFRDITAVNCHACAAYITGLPERKVENLAFHNVKVSFDPQAQPFVPAMANNVEPMVHQGLIVQHVETLMLDHVDIQGQDGQKLVLTDVSTVQRMN